MLKWRRKHRLSGSRMQISNGIRRVYAEAGRETIISVARTLHVVITGAPNTAKRKI